MTPFQQRTYTECFLVSRAYCKRVQKCVMPTVTRHSVGPPAMHTITCTQASLTSYESRFLAYQTLLLLKLYKSMGIVFTGTLRVASSPHLEWLHVYYAEFCSPIHCVVHRFLQCPGHHLTLAQLKQTGSIKKSSIHLIQASPRNGHMWPYVAICGLQCYSLFPDAYAQDSSRCLKTTN